MQFMEVAYLRTRWSHYPRTSSDAVSLNVCITWERRRESGPSLLRQSCGTGVQLRIRAPSHRAGSIRQPIITPVRFLRRVLFAIQVSRGRQQASTGQMLTCCSAHAHTRIALIPTIHLSGPLMAQQNAAIHQLFNKHRCNI